MSGVGMVWARQQRVGRPGAKSLLLLLAEISNEQGETYGSQKYLAEILECSRKAVNENMAYLLERKFISVSGRVDPVTGKRLTNRVELLIGEIQAVKSPRSVPDETHVTMGYMDPEVHVTSGHTDPPDPCNPGLQLINNTQLLNNELSTSDADAPTQMELPELPVDPDEVRSSSIEHRFDPMVNELCDYLARWIEKNTGKKPAYGVQWLVACERLMRIDEKTPQQIRGAIDWSQSNEFWCANILSMPKLREKYNQLALQAQRERSAPPRQSMVNNRLEVGAKMVARLQRVQDELDRKELSQ